MEPLLTAILDDDPAKVAALLQAEPELATQRITVARLYESKIYHWIYVGDTALHLAAAGYRVEIARLLLAAGADPNAAKNHRRGCPLHYASDWSTSDPDWDPATQVQMIRCLLDAGANINAQDMNGASPLHRAIRTRAAAATRCLLQAGADATLKNKSGSTPFHLAVQNTGRGGAGLDQAKAGQRKIIRELLTFGVSTALKDGKGKTVLESASPGWVVTMLSENLPDH